MIVNIPGLKDSVGVGVFANYYSPSGKENINITDDQTTPLLKLPQADHTGTLKVRVFLYFPPSDGAGHSKPENHYTQVLTAEFPRIKLKNGKLYSLLKEKPLQGEPLDPKAQYRSPFQFIEGKVWLSASEEDPRAVLVKVRVSVGSEDVVVTSDSLQVEEATWNVGVEGGGEGGSGGLISKIVKGAVKLGFKAERSEEKETRTTGTSRQISKMAQTREYTLELELPEKRPEPKPRIYNEGGIFFMYFDTKQKDVRFYKHPRTKTDQLQDLKKFLDEQIVMYGEENIKEIKVHGYASSLGETQDNEKLSGARAKYVAERIKATHGLKIGRILAKGEPLIQSSDKDNSWKDRNVTVSVEARRVVNP